MTLKERLQNAVSYTEVLLKSKNKAGLDKAYLERMLILLKDVLGLPRPLTSDELFEEGKKIFTAEKKDQV